MYNVVNFSGEDEKWNIHHRSQEPVIVFLLIFNSSVTTEDWNTALTMLLVDTIFVCSTKF